jgi:hypothetical protein
MPKKFESNTSTLRLLKIWAREVITLFRMEQNANQTRPPADEPVLESDVSELGHPRNECERDWIN